MRLDRRCVSAPAADRRSWMLLPVLVLVAGCSSAAIDVPAAAGTQAPQATATSSPTTPWVDPTATGVPEGVFLRPSGPLKIDRDGAVVEGLDINGCVTVDADDVVIRNSRIRCSDPSASMVLHLADGKAGLVIEHSEIDGTEVVEVGVGWTGYTLRYVDIHGVNDGARFGHNVVIEDSWVHDMTRLGDLHPDALQTTSASNVVIRRNVLEPTNEVTGDRNNAAIMLGSETGTKLVTGVLIEDNLLDGGSYALNIRGDINAAGVEVRNNAFGQGSRYGAVIAPSSIPLGAGNVTVSGSAVTADPAK